MVACGAKKKVTAGSVLKGVLKKVGKKVADDAGDQAGEYIGDYLGDLFLKGFDTAKEFMSQYTDDEKELLEEWSKKN